MSISREIIESHVENWEATLARGAYPYRKAWPSSLFCHEPIENAASIIKSSTLLPRHAAAIRGMICRDIAPQNIIASTERAHGHVRLYFRPRNPTQYHIEGIRKDDEVYQGKHAPVLVIFVFKSRSVLTIDGVEFSDGNMQSMDSSVFSGNDGFTGLPFAEIYHEGPFSRDRAAITKRRRCAEVLVPNELPLDSNLQAILCRSAAERAYLLYLLGDHGDTWKDRIRVYKKPGIFQSEYAYLESVQCSPSKVSFSFHPRRDGKSIWTELEVHNSKNERVFQIKAPDLSTAKNWYVTPVMPEGEFLVSIKIEGCLAYQANCIIDNFPF